MVGIPVAERAQRNDLGASDWGVMKIFEGLGEKTEQERKMPMQNNLSGWHSGLTRKLEALTG
jgi:hypothetical protein